jgi:hypothetical protein
MSWTRLCSVSGSRKIVRPASNLRTNLEPHCIWFSSGAPKKILPFDQADELLASGPRLSSDLTTIELAFRIHTHRSQLGEMMKALGKGDDTNPCEAVLAHSWMHAHLAVGERHD